MTRDQRRKTAIAAAGMMMMGSDVFAVDVSDGARSRPS